MHGIQSLKAGDLAGFSALLDIYEISFPATERKSAAWLRQMLEGPLYRFLTLPGPAGIDAFAVVMHASTQPITLLEYMAVAPSSRGKGLGRALFKHVASLAAEQGRALILEIEAGESVDQVRRRSFYRTLGAQPLEVPYTMPQVAGAPPPPMELLWIPNGHRQPSQPTGLQWVRDIHREAYCPS